MKRLLIPVDFSEESIAAIENGIQIANNVGLALTMIHVKKKKNYYMGFSTTSEEQYPDDVLEAQFNQVLIDYKNKYTAGGDFNYIIAHGSISHEIVKEAHKEDVYAICTALQGNTSLRDYLIGSNAHRVLSASKVPVFSVRKEMGLRTTKKILMPIDDSANSRLKVPFVTEMAIILNAKVIVCALTDTPFDEINNRVANHAKQAFNYMGNAGVNVTLKEEYNAEMSKKLVELTVQDNVDLLAFHTDMIEGPIGLMMSGSVRYILHKSQCPLLCIPVNK